MRYVADHDFHIHSTLSSCCHDEKQTVDAIQRYAVENGFKKICLTNHFWDADVPGASGWYLVQDFRHLTKALPLPQRDGVRFCFGAETELDKHFTLAMTKKRFDDFDFVIIPTTHLHMKGLTIDENRNTPADRAELWVKRLQALLTMDLPWYKIGIAHLTCSLMLNEEQTPEVLGLIPTQTMEELFRDFAKKGVGIELNFDSFALTDETREIMLKPYRIAKEAGCKFYLGSDAHSIKALNAAKENFENIIDLLGLEESDKFDF